MVHPFWKCFAAMHHKTTPLLSAFHLSDVVLR